MDAFAQLTPEQRRDKELDVNQLGVPSLGLTAGARTHQGAGDSRSGIRSVPDSRLVRLGVGLSDSRHGGALESRGSRRGSSRGSRDSRGSRTPSAGGSFVAELTAENLGDLETAAGPDLSLGFAQRYLPNSAYVLREMQQRHTGRPERDSRLVNRRQELMELLTA